VADTGNGVVRLITSSGMVETQAGIAGEPGFADGTGTEARFASPGGIALDGSGNIYVSDTGNNAIRKGLPNVPLDSLNSVLPETGEQIAIDAFDSDFIPLGYQVVTGTNTILSGVDRNIITFTAPGISTIRAAARAANAASFNTSGQNNPGEGTNDPYPPGNGSTGTVGGGSGIEVMGVLEGIPNQVYGAATAVTPPAADMTTQVPVSISVSGPAQLTGNDVLKIEGTGTVTVTATEAATGTYAAATPETVTFVVNPAPLTITANNFTKTYGQVLTFAGTEFSPSGLVNNDSIETVTLSSAGAPGTASVSSSPYTVVPSNPSGSAFSSDNYTINYVPGTVTVNPATLMITALNETKLVSNTLNFTGSEFSSTGLQNGEAIGSVTLASSGADSSATIGGSPYQIVPSNATGGTFDPSNYSIIYVDGELAIYAAATETTSDWVNLYFNSTQLADPNVSGLTAAPQGDHVANVLKYLCDIDPSQPMTSSDQQALPTVDIDSTTTPNTTYLALKYRESPVQGGAGVTLQMSSDLKTWTNATPTIDQPVGTDTATGDPIMEIGVTMSSQTRRQFIRLNVSAPSP
jgi:hypothetical protein